MHVTPVMHVTPASPARRRFGFALLLAALTASHCVRRPAPEIVSGDGGGATLRVRLGDAGAPVREIPLERYVEGTLLAEMPLHGLESGTAARVAELQAIVSRTYAVANRRRHADERFDLCSTTHCQAYRPIEQWPEPDAHVAQEASRHTKGVVILHAGRPINALFHAHCGGHTSDASIAWGGHTPGYLRGGPDSYCLRDDEMRWRLDVGAAELRQMLNQDAATSVGAHLDSLVVVDRDEGGRAVSVRLVGERTVEVRAEALRAAVTRRLGARSMRSTRVEVRRRGDRFIFDGQGFGHGVGLCQTGAIARARAGHDPAAIIRHYYPDTTLSTPDASHRSVLN